MIGPLRGRFFVSCLWAAIAAFGLLQTANAQQWQQTSGAARDVGVGANGAVWVVGTDAMKGGYQVWRRDGSTWTPTQVGALRIAVAPNGDAYIVDDKREVIRLSAGGTKDNLPGKATDVGVGADGTVWIIGDKTEAGGYSIHRLAGKRWTKIPGSAVRISVDPSGNAWVVNSSNNVFKYDGGQFVSLPGTATDIGIGADGAVWTIGTDGGIYRFEGTKWAKKTGGATQIAAGAGGSVWVVNAGGAIFQAQVSSEVVVTPPNIVIAPPPQVINVAPVTNIAAPTTPIVISGGTAVNVTPPASTTAPVAAGPIDPKNPWRVFPRGGQYEAKILQAIRFQRFANLIFLGGQAPAASSLSPLERAFADTALSSTEAYFSASPLPADHAIARVQSSDEARRAVITYIGLGVIARVGVANNTPEGVALRQWATDVHRSIKIKTAKAMVDEYRRWSNDPCGYENLPAERCKGLSSMFSPPRPSQETIAKLALGSVMAGYANEITVATATGLTAVSMGASGAVLTAALGATGWSSISGTATSLVSLYSAFGGSGGTAGAASGAIGASGWAGVVAAPVAAAVLVVVVGTSEGIAVVEAARVEPMLKLKLGAAMTDTIVLQNEFTDVKERDFFLLAYQTAAIGGFNVPTNTVNGEVRYFCQAGYVCRFKLAYNAGGAKSFTTKDLPVGHEESFAIPYNATNIVASGEWFDGFTWKSLFTRNLAKPTYIGFTAYGTVFGPAYKDEYPEISNIQAPPNQLIVTQGGGYVAWIRASYTQNGVVNRVVEVKDAGAGWRQEITIPKDATNIRLEAWSNTGWVGEPWKTIIDHTWPSPPNVCIKTYNTTLDPKWNNECK